MAETSLVPLSALRFRLRHDVDHPDGLAPKLGVAGPVAVPAAFLRDRRGPK